MWRCQLTRGVCVWEIHNILRQYQLLGFCSAYNSANSARKLLFAWMGVGLDFMNLSSTWNVVISVQLTQKFWIEVAFQALLKEIKIEYPNNHIDSELWQHRNRENSEKDSKICKNWSWLRAGEHKAQNQIKLTWSWVAPNQKKVENSKILKKKMKVDLELAVASTKPKKSKIPIDFEPVGQAQNLEFSGKKIKVTSSWRAQSQKSNWPGAG